MALISYNNVLSSTNLVKWLYSNFPRNFCISHIIPAEGNCWWQLSAFYVLPCHIYNNNFWEKYIFSSRSLSSWQSLFSFKLYLSGLSRSVLISSFLKWNNIQNQGGNWTKSYMHVHVWERKKLLSTMSVKYDSCSTVSRIKKLWTCSRYICKEIIIVIS